MTTGGMMYLIMVLVVALVFFGLLAWAERQTCGDD